MRLSLGLLVIGSVALVACGGEDSGGIRRGTGTGGEPTPGGDTTPVPGGPTGPAAVACPAGVPAAIALSTTDKNAHHVRVVASGVIYQDGLNVVRVNPQTTARTTLYTSQDLVSSFADDTVIVTVESPNAPDAVLKVMPVGPTTDDKPDPITVTPANWNAGGTYVFASDAKSFYVVADVTGQGDTIYKVDKANPNLMTVLAQLNAALGDPQLAGNDVWFVRDQKRVYKVVQPVEAGDPTLPAGGVIAGPAEPPTEVFGIGYAACKLAVGGKHAFCSTGTALEQRDLSGANMTTVLEPEKGAAPTLLGSALYGSDTVYVRSLPATATDALKNGIRAVQGTTEKFIACGRDPINAVAVGGTTVVWAEQGKGVFMAPR